MSRQLPRANLEDVRADASGEMTFETAQTVAKARGWQSFDSFMAAQQARYDRDMPWMRELHTRKARYVEYVRGQWEFEERNASINKGNAEFMNSLTERLAHEAGE